MNFFKKTVACLAAATVMTSMAVTASAEYQISGVNGNDGKYYLRIIGLPEQLSNDPSHHPVGGVTVAFPESQLQFYLVFTVFNRTNEVQCKLMMNDLEVKKLPCQLLTFEKFDNKLGFLVDFSVDDELRSGLILANTLKVSCVMAGYFDYDSDGNISGNHFDYYDGNGNTISEEDSYDYFEMANVTWQPVGGDDGTENTDSSESEPASEPTSSEPASEPTSSEPVSEPAASEPVSSEPTTSQPSNVDTGTASVAAVVGTAVLAAGAVIVTRKKK